MSDTMKAAQQIRPVVLCVLDGWGYREQTEDNAVALANTPNWDRLFRTVPQAFLNAAAENVGLPKGQMGNSEVGHMNLGAGRVVMQDLPRIDTAIEDGSLDVNPVLVDFIKSLRATGGRCHLMGLMSPGGVHSMQQHMAALARRVARDGVPVIVHSMLDGRDTPPSSGAGYLEDFIRDTADVRGLSFGVVTGRYYAMDRDNRWDRVAKAYRAFVDAKGEGGVGADPVSIVRDSYEKKVTDEFVLPTIVAGYDGMKDGDGLLVANFRADRVREILGALVMDDFKGFPRDRVVRLGARAGMAEYSTDLAPYFPPLFPPVELTNILGQVVSEAGRTQLRIAETEKYAHVTFFLNGGREELYPGEDRIMVPSPKVATYDLQPEMSAPEVTDKVVAAIGSGKFDLIVINFANGDMVGHSGILAAAIKAAEAVDMALGRLVAAVEKAGGALIVTADHGNCEMMRDPETGEPHTAHTTNPVPVLLVNAPAWADGIHNGKLADVAPTVLKLMGLPQPKEMTGRSLIDEGRARDAAQR